MYVTFAKESNDLKIIFFSTALSMPVELRDSHVLLETPFFRRKPNSPLTKENVVSQAHQTCAANLVSVVKMKNEYAHLYCEWPYDYARDFPLAYRYLFSYERSGY